IDGRSRIELADRGGRYAHQSEAPAVDEDAVETSVRSDRRRADLGGDVGEPVGHPLLDAVEIPAAAAVRCEEEAVRRGDRRLLEGAVRDHESTVAGFGIEEVDVRIPLRRLVGYEVDALLGPVQPALGVGAAAELADLGEAALGG